MAIASQTSVRLSPPPDRRRHGVRNRCRCLYGLVLACTLLAITQVAALQTVQEHLERGYHILAQARQTRTEAQHEHLLAAAAEAFSQAYQQAGQGGKVQALVGAAQAYLHMHKAPAVFPFLWSAPPLQRAAKSLQQALVLQPDDSAAALLLGFTLWRQASTAATPSIGLQQRSLAHLARAAALGIPVRLPTIAAGQPASGITPFGVQDTILLVRHVDARGTGQTQDLLLAYRTAGDHGRDYGIVVSSGIAYPLTSTPVNGTMAPDGRLNDLQMALGPHNSPMVVAVIQRHGHAVEKHFVWQTSRFVCIGECPAGS